MFQFACACGETISVDEGLAGSRTRCPGCGAALVVPQPPAPGETKVCPYCGERIKAGAKKCPRCQEFLDPSARPAAAAPPPFQPGGGLSGPEYQASTLGNQSLGYAIAGAVFPCIGLLQMQAITRGEQAKTVAKTHRIPVPGTASAGVMIGYIGLLHALWWTFYTAVKFLLR